MKLTGLQDQDELDYNKITKCIRNKLSEDVKKLSVGDYKRLAIYILDAIESMDDKFSKHSTIREGIAMRQKIMDNYPNLSDAEKNMIFAFNRTITSYADVSDRNKLEINNRNMIEMIIIFTTLYLVNEVNVGTKAYAPGYVNATEYKKLEDDIILLRGYLEALKRFGPNIRTDSVDNVVRKIISSEKRFIRTCYFTVDPEIDACREGFFKTLLDAGLVSICVDLRSIVDSPKDVCCTFYVNDKTSPNVKNKIVNENAKAANKSGQFWTCSKKKLKQPPHVKRVLVCCPNDEFELGNIADFPTIEELISFIRNGGLNL